MNNPSAGFEESAAAAEELNAQAETMKGSVAELLKLVGGTDQSKESRVTIPQNRNQQGQAAKPAKHSGRGGNGQAMAAVGQPSSALLKRLLNWLGLDVETSFRQAVL